MFIDLYVLMFSDMYSLPNDLVCTHVYRPITFLQKKLKGSDLSNYEWRMSGVFGEEWSAYPLLEVEFWRHLKS
jgi:hypothetical protein